MIAITALSLLLSLSTIASAEHISWDQAQSWATTWRDDFDGQELNTQGKEGHWIVETNGCGGGNNEAQWYVPDNVAVANGLLSITPKQRSFTQENKDCHDIPDKKITRQFTSGRLRTSGCFSHGLYTTRAQLPNGTYLWPSTWLLCKDGTCDENNYLEIDTLESYGPDFEFTYASTFWYNTQDKDQASFPYSDVDFQTLRQDFHDFSVLWTPGFIQFFIDGNSILRKDSETVDFFDYTNVKEAVHVDKMCVNAILNVAIGGNGRTVDGKPADFKTLKQDSAFWTSFDVDYFEFKAMP